MKLLTFFIITLFLLNCGKDQNDANKNILSQEQLSSLLIQIYIGEAVADNLPFVKDSSIKYFAPFEQKLLKSRNIPDSVLRETYRYYIAHPKELEKVYDVVIDSLTLKEQSANAPKAKAEEK